MTIKRLRFGVAVWGGALAICAGVLHAQPVGQKMDPQTVQPQQKAVKAAAKAADKPVWSQLSPAQKIALEPLQSEWDRMESLRKQKWLEMANRYATMKPEEQQRVHERMREWVQLTPAQRSAARQNYTQAKTLAPNEKSATWESYKQLPDEQKQKLAEQAARKQLTNLPPAKSTQRSTTPVLHGAATCPAGSVRNPAAATPACVASASPAPPAAPAPAVATSAAPVK